MKYDLVHPQNISELGRMEELIPFCEGHKRGLPGACSLALDT